MISLDPTVMWGDGRMIIPFSSWGSETVGNTTTLPISWEAYKYVKKQSMEPAMKQWNGSKLGQEYVEAAIVMLLI